MRGSQDFHGDDSNFLLECLGQGRCEKSPQELFNRVDRQHDSINRPLPYGPGQDIRIMMTCNPYMFDLAALFSLDKCLQSPIGPADGFKILGRSQVMDLPEIEVIGMQPLQGLIQVGKSPCLIPYAGFAGLKYFLPGPGIFLPN